MGSKKKKSHHKNAKSKDSKKSHKKHKKSHDQSDQPTGLNILGDDAAKVGTAIAGAVVGEIAQVAMKKLGQATADDDRLGNVRHSVHNAVDATKEVVHQAKPSVQEAVDAVQQVVEEIKPSVSGVVNDLTNRDQKDEGS